MVPPWLEGRLPPGLLDGSWIQFIPAWCGLSWCQTWGLEQHPSRQGPRPGGGLAPSAGRKTRMRNDARPSQTKHGHRGYCQRDGGSSKAASGTEKGLLEGLAAHEMARGRVPGQGTAPARALRQEQACVDTGHQKEQACIDTEHEMPECSAWKGEGLGAWCR